MATYKNSDGKELYLYRISSSVFSANDGYWPCTTSSDSNYNIDTSFKLDANTAIKALNSDNVILIAQGASGEGTDFYFSFNTDEVNRGLANSGSGTTLYACITSGNTNHSTAYSADAYWYFNGVVTPSLSYYLWASTPVGSYSISSSAKPCNSSTYYNGNSSCCSSSQTTGCGCSSKESGSACGGISVQYSDCGCNSARTVGCCVSEDTLILTSNGYKLAKDITINDRIMSSLDGILIENENLTIYKRLDKIEIYRISFSDKTTLFITEKHPILCEDNIYRTCLELEKMEEFPFVKSLNGTKKILKIESFRNNGTVYNYLVDGDNFIANDIIIGCENPDLIDDLFVISEDNAFVKENGDTNHIW